MVHLIMTFWKISNSTINRNSTLLTKFSKVNNNNILKSLISCFIGLLKKADTMIHDDDPTNEPTNISKSQFKLAM